MSMSMSMRYSSRLLTMLGFVLLSAIITLGQTDTPMVPPDKDLGDIYRRASASRFVVVGVVDKSRGVGSRSSESDEQKLKTHTPNGQAIVELPVLGGSLYTIRIETTLCRQEDFRITQVQPRKVLEDPGQIVYVFVPRTEPMFVGGHRQEFLQPGVRYLLFLYEPPRQKQLEWTKSFELEPQQIYYRGEELSRGIIPLPKAPAESPPPEPPPILDKVTRLCEAVAPPDVADKLARLKKLAKFGDPVLAKEAGAAAKALERKIN